MLKNLLLPIILCAIAPMLASSDIPSNSNASVTPSTQGTGPAQATSPFSLGDRPEAIQKEVNSALSALAHETAPWQFNGSRSYMLMNLYDLAMVRDVVARAGDKKDIYFIDAGCGDGRWGKFVAAILNDTYAASDKKFHLLSLTGGKELGTSSVQTEGNVTHYRSCNFCLENISTELPKHGFDIGGRVDLIVSSWTLRHLVDPLGTLKQLYNLLAPIHGTLLGDGFYLEMPEQAQADFGSTSYSYDGYWKLLTHCTDKSLFHQDCGGGTLDQFLLIRSDARPFNLPISYTGTIKNIGKQNASEVSCQFETNISFRGEPEFRENTGWPLPSIYYGTAKSQDLFNELIQRGLIPSKAERDESRRQIVLKRAYRKAYQGVTNGWRDKLGHNDYLDANSKTLDCINSFLAHRKKEDA